MPPIRGKSRLIAPKIFRGVPAPATAIALFAPQVIAPTCINLHTLAQKNSVLHGIPGKQSQQVVLQCLPPTDSKRVLNTALQVPYRSHRAPYRYITGSGHAFRSMFMRVLTGLTGPAPQGGVPGSNAQSQSPKSKRRIRRQQKSHFSREGTTSHLAFFSPVFLLFAPRSLSK